MNTVMAVLAAAAICLAPRAASPATLLVNPGPSTIHSALAVASPGDTLMLQPGTYSTSSPVDIHKVVTIMSAQGPDVTIVDMQYNFGSVFYIDAMASAPTIEGLTIKRGVQIFTGVGGGVYSIGASPRIINNLFVMNAASNIDGYGGGGAAIAVLDGAPTIRQNTIVNNFASYGAVFLDNCAGEMDHNIVAYNFDTHDGKDTGYGLACFNASTAVHDNIFWANETGQITPSCGLQIGTGNNVLLDPQFCSPVIGPKATNDNWQVMADAPSAPGHAYFGWGATLPTCAATSAVARSWGSIKAQYR